MAAENEDQAVIDRGDTLADGAPPVEDHPDDSDIKKVAEIADAAADDADDEAEKGEKGKKDTRVPLKRHTELLNKERDARAAVEAELAKYKGGEQVAKVNEEIGETETKLLDMEKTYTGMLADGEMEKAAALMGDIRRLERSISEQKAEMKAQTAEIRAVERVRYDVTVERLEAAFPALNPDHESFDGEQTKEVLELKNAYEVMGLAPSAALQKAVKVIMKAETSKQETATEVTPRVSAEDVAKERAAAARKKNVETAARQPADNSKIGADSDKIGGVLTAENIMTLSQEEFAKLDEKALAKARGDAL